MSTTDTIFISTDLPLEQVAAVLSEKLNLSKNVDAKDRIFLVRALSEKAGREVGGEIEQNPHLPVPDPQPDEISVIDGYSIAWDVWTLARDEDISRAATRALFLDLTTAFPSWPAILVQNLGLLIAASHPDTGLVEFPPDTSPDGEDRELWRRFDVLPDRE